MVISERSGIFERIMGITGAFPDLYREFYVPDELDHEVSQPEGVVVRLSGPKSNVNVIFETADNYFSFNSLAPIGTRFRINEFNYHGFESDSDKKEIIVPRNLSKLRNNPAFCILHEGGHIWSKKDKAWKTEYDNAESIFGTEKWLEDRHGKPVSLPKNPVEKERHVMAWKAYGEEERRASAAALYTVGRLRNEGVDILPHIHTIESMTRLINKGLKSHERVGLRFRFSDDDTQRFLEGDLSSVQGLGSILKSHLDTEIPKIVK